MSPRSSRKQAVIHWGKAHRVNGLLKGEITMSINMSNNENIPTDTEAYYNTPPKECPLDPSSSPEAYYATLASQEKVYLEKTEEELRATLTSDDPSRSRNSG